MLYELPQFGYFEPETLEEAIGLLGQLGTRAKALAGGTDLLGLMKDRISGPEMPIPTALINIKKIARLRSLAHSETESTFGAALTLSEINSDLETADRFPGFVQAARSVATLQIRNMGTLGGNLCQRPWCWYFRHPAFNCFKKGGKQCYAITGDNSTYFSVYNIGTCVMAHPSDTAPALISLDASVKIAGKNGIKDVALSDFFLGPKNVQDNILSPEEILVSVTVPRSNSNRRSVYLKFRPRNNWDFALASAAASGDVDERGRVNHLRIVLGGVSPLPIILSSVQNIIVGERYNQALKSEALKLSAKLAKPLRMNKYKVRIVCALVGRALDAVLVRAPTNRSTC